MNPRPLNRDERAAILKLTGKAVIRVQEAKALNEEILASLKFYRVEHFELLTTALHSLSDFDRLRILAFLLSLKRQVGKTTERQVTAKLTFDPQEAYKTIVAHLREKGRKRIVGASREKRGKRTAAGRSKSQRRSVNPAYDYDAGKHTGPALREALNLSRMGFFDLCRRRKVRGFGAPGKAKTYTREDARKLLLARLDAMSTENRKKAARAIVMAIEQREQFNPYTFKSLVHASPM